jgi:uncharacterized Zn finger protein
MTSKIICEKCQGEEFELTAHDTNGHSRIIAHCVQCGFDTEIIDTSELYGEPREM